MKSTGVVVGITGEKAKIRVVAGSECMGCPSKQHCHGGEVKPRDIVAVNNVSANIHDRVVFESEPGKVVFSAAMVWIVPVLAMISGYVIAERFAGGFVPIAGALGFLVLAFGLLKLFDRAITGGTAFYPTITSIVESGVDPGDPCHGAD